MYAIRIKWRASIDQCIDAFELSSIKFCPTCHSHLPRLKAPLMARAVCDPAISQHMSLQSLAAQVSTSVMTLVHVSGLLSRNVSRVSSPGIRES